MALDGTFTGEELLARTAKKHTAPCCILVRAKRGMANTMPLLKTGHNVDLVWAAPSRVCKSLQRFDQPYLSTLLL